MMCKEREKEKGAGKIKKVHLPLMLQVQVVANNC